VLPLLAIPSGTLLSGRFIWALRRSRCELANLLGETANQHSRIHQRVNWSDAVSGNDVIGEMLNEDRAIPIAVGIVRYALWPANLNSGYPALANRGWVTPLVGCDGVCDFLDFGHT